MRESTIAVYGAIIANSAIAVTKFVVAGISGSSAMLSEGIHSTVDAGNGALLLVGLHRSRIEASVEHPFGHGKELFFWSLIVAVLIFGAGGGVSAYEGVLHILHPQPLRDPFWNYVVLAAAGVFEGASLALALRGFLRTKGDRPFWEALRASKDPATYTVIAEDSAALLGLVFAAAGIWASHYFNVPELDGVASVLIGLLLAAVAVLLIRESRGLLVGEGIGPNTAREIRRIALADARVVGAGRPLSMYIGPEEVLLTLDVRFSPDIAGDGIAETVRSIEAKIRETFPRIRRIYIEAVTALPEQQPA